MFVGIRHFTVTCWAMTAMNYKQSFAISKGIQYTNVFQNSFSKE
jgi:hypothetical protein